MNLKFQPSYEILSSLRGLCLYTYIYMYIYIYHHMSKDISRHPHSRPHPTSGKGQDQTSRRPTAWNAGSLSFQTEKCTEIFMEILFATHVWRSFFLDAETGDMLRSHTFSREFPIKMRQRSFLAAPSVIQEKVHLSHLGTRHHLRCVHPIFEDWHGIPEAKIGDPDFQVRSWECLRLDMTLVLFSE